MRTYKLCWQSNKQFITLCDRTLYRGSVQPHLRPTDVDKGSFKRDELYYLEKFWINDLASLFSRLSDGANEVRFRYKSCVPVVDSIALSIDELFILRTPRYNFEWKFCYKLSEYKWRIIIVPSSSWDWIIIFYIRISFYLESIWWQNKKVLVLILRYKVLLPPIPMWTINCWTDLDKILIPRDRNTSRYVCIYIKRYNIGSWGLSTWTLRSWDLFNMGSCRNVENVTSVPGKATIHISRDDDDDDSPF